VFLSGAATLLGAATARAQTLLPGDRLVYETAAAFGFERLPRRLPDPCSIETRLAIGIGRVDDSGMDIDLEVGLGVRAVRYSGPTFSWALEPATKDGFIGAPITTREAEDIASAPLPYDTPPLAREVVRRQLALIAVVAALHGAHASARIACGAEPFVRIDHIEGAALTEEQRVVAERYLRAVLLLALPPVPAALASDAEAFTAGGARYEVVGRRDAYWPIKGREHRVRAVEPSSAARAAFAFEAMHDTGLEPAGPDPAVREWADVHATLAIASRRQVRVASLLSKRGDVSARLAAVATWTTDLVRATRPTLRKGGDAVDVPIDAPRVAP